MAGAQQLRLLLWKDYLIRKRKLITLIGVAWAVAVMLSLYIVRINVDNQDFPTCSFPARALPSAGLVTFLQSFLCGVNNECTPMDRFEEIPTYEDSKLTQLQRKFSPLLYNATVLETAGTVPDALKLLSTLSDIADQPTFVDISKNGLRVEELFKRPERVKRTVAAELDLPKDVVDGVMSSEISFQGIFQGGLDRCSAQSLSNIITVKDGEQTVIFAEKLCSLSDDQLQKIAIKLLMEVDFEKYIAMASEMYFKLSGDGRLSRLGDALSAVLRMARVESFLPPELVHLFLGAEADFNYFNLTIIPKILEIFNPTFGDTQIYKTLNDVSGVLVTGVQYLNRIVKPPTNSVVDNLVKKEGAMSVFPAAEAIQNAVAVFKETTNNTADGVFNVIAQVTKLIYKFLPEDTKFEVSFYSTLFAKLMEGALKVININTHIQQMAYDVSLRNTDGVKVLTSLPTNVVGKGFDALADPERTQILTSKLNYPNQMFCDGGRIAGFFRISKNEAEDLKKKLCTSAWKAYISDLIKSFGIYEVRDNINVMASLVIQRTLGKDVSEQMYSLDKTFDVIKNFTKGLAGINDVEKVEVDWLKLFNVAEDSDFMKVVREKGHLGKQMLITVHGALAKEVVKQNALLEFKISPTLIDITTIVEAMNDELALMPADLIDRLKKQYPKVLQTMLLTMLSEYKTYKYLSTSSEEILCSGNRTLASTSEYIEFSFDADDDLVSTLCDASEVIERGLKRDSVIAKAIVKVTNSSHSPLESINWTKLINNVKSLYMKLSTDLPYLFEYKTYGMDEKLQLKVRQLLEDAKDFWFNWNHMDRSLHLSVKLLFRVLDLMDHEIFNITDQIWIKVKQVLSICTGPFIIITDIVKDINALMNHTEAYTSKLPSKTAEALGAIVPNIPHLIVDAANIIVNDDTDIAPIISLMNSDPPWPCSTTSISEYLTLNDNSKLVVKGIETLVCMDTKLQQQWRNYIDVSTLNETSPHIFLKFSSVLDSLISDVSYLRQMLTDIFNETITITNGNMSVMAAWKYAVEAVKSTEKNVTFGNFFAKVDTVLVSINTSFENQSTNAIWEDFIKCSNTTLIDHDCKMVGRGAWKYTLVSLSVALENMADDLTTYFKEANEPDSNLLQLLGFTRKTGLYILYDKLPEFVSTLINSYWDYGFMSQIRRASLSEFWDCEAVLDSLVPLPGNGIDSSIIEKVKPFVCPSLLHWISLPRGDNTLLDVVAKPQYYFFTLSVQNLTSSFKNAFIKATEMTNLLMDIAKKNQTLITENDVKINSIQEKLTKTVDIILNYKISASDPSYRLYAQINIKQFYSMTYLTRIVATINKLATKMDNLKIDDIKTDENENNLKKLDKELYTIQKIFKRWPTDAVALHFDLLTDIAYKDNENFKIVDVLEEMCENLKNNNADIDILNEGNKIKSQICAKNYRVIYEAVDNVVTKDIGAIRQALFNLRNVLQSGDVQEVGSIAEFLNQRKQVVNTLKGSIKYAYDLGIPIYLKYLQNSLENYNIILDFLSGENWWSELRSLYDGPHATKFLDTVEMSCEIAEDILTKLDKIHLVRLLRDIEVNSTTSFCRANVTLSDYISDSTGALSSLKQQVCDSERTEIFKEIPPLVFAAQGYDSELKLPKEIDYAALNAIIIKTETNLQKIKDGPKAPERPSWINDEKITNLRNVALQLLSKESLTKIAFGVIGNLVDGSTLFLNSSQCVFCSEFTTWFKQINLQLIKKQEYDNLLCHLPTMTLDDVHNTLKNDFHWDMAIRELISYRNYTKYEMNKSVNEMLEQIKLHLLEDLTANTSKLEECLAKNVSRNEFGNATIFFSVLAHTIRLIRAELPHFHEINGIKDVPYLKKLASEVAHKLDVIVPIKKYLTKENDLTRSLGEVVEIGLVKDMEESDVNLRLIGNFTQAPVRRYILLSSNDWDVVCRDVDCELLSDIVFRNINKTLANKDLPKLQFEEYWRFTFTSNILYHLENFIHHASRLLGVASNLDVTGALEGRLASMIDLMMALLGDDMLNGIVFSVHGIRHELHPILHETPLDHDLDAVTQGLVILQNMKKQMVDKDNLKVEVSSLFSDHDYLETALSRIGINNTNFWSIAAPRIHAGHLTLKPIFSSEDDYHISRFVCQPDWMSKVIHPADLDLVTSEDVYAAVVDQFCQLSDVQAKKAVLILVQNLNFSFIVEKVKDVLLTKLYNASELTEAEGATVLDSLPQMAALLPTIQSSVGDLGDTLAKEPLFQQLRNFSSVGNLLSSSDFMSSAGKMICGKPFYANVNRFYKTVAQTKDFSTEPEQAQLDLLPTDFCRSLYSDIINIEGGKIVWSFVKPLLMGKILYTPDTPVVQKIIHKANETFAHMTKLTGLVHSFARAFFSVDKLSQHRDGVSALQSILSSPGLAKLKATLVGDMELPNMDVGELFDDFGDLKGIGNLLGKASDLLRCINLNRFHSAPDEVELTHNAARLSVVNEFSAGLVFLNADKHTDNASNIEYKIRMDIDNVPTTARLRNYMWTPGPEASFLEDMRYFRGFIQIQDLIDRAIIDLAQNRSRTKREVKEEMKWAVYTQQTPYPCYRKDFFQTSIYESQALLVAFFFSLLFTVASAVRFMVAEKESGNTMLMSVMGVDLTYHTMSWFIASLVEMTITTACVAGVLWLGGILPRTTPSLIFTILFIFGVSVLCFCYMISKLFSTASLGAVCSAILYLVTFMPIVLVLSLEAVMSSMYKLFVCLSMSSALCYAFLYIARYEAMGAGAGWAQLWAAPTADEDMSIGAAASMLLVDALLYLAVGWLIDRFFGPKTLRSNITQCVTSGEKAGVSILNITKIYNEGSRRQKLALDNVSVELHKGQITTLLGHNGAGKTTLINIVTGMLRPTKGHVSVWGARARGARLGACPQRDVLLEPLSAREHVALYAQLKTGLPLRQLQHEIDSMLQVLSLGSVSTTPVCRLSGGTRRRVCVGLAFVGNPHLVVLDEPTAGVDPAARRDIWSMIVKLKEDRTILLTTHHLDEAELLSDQIVIMHKGQIHTTGSPVEIKRTLGTGYKLNVFFPKKDDWPNDEEVSIEEKTKQLLTLVRDVIKNAGLIDVNGMDVEISLPFFDANGLNNNFLQLCLTLEGAQASLGFKSYSLDCSSLEQVFFNICDQVDSAPHPIEYIPEDTPSKSASSSSIRNDNAPLVDGDGPLKGTTRQQFLALLHARYIHYTRNRWLLSLLLVVPALFVTTAMSFSTVRPPPDNERPLRLRPALYDNATEFLVSNPSIYSMNVDPSFAQHVIDTLKSDKETKNWTYQDTPSCACGETRQECNITNLRTARPRVMTLPDVNVTNDWLVKSQELYLEKRYGGFSTALKNNMTALIAWYNNKGHHAMPSFLSALNSATLKTILGDSASITTYSHPMKISKEQISKDTVYQHVADAGISALVLIAYSLVSAGSAVYLVHSRVTQQKRLHYLCGVTPALYWSVALTWDMIIIAINMIITAVVMEAFHFPVFVSKSNLPAICVLILLFGYSCANLVHLAEKLFSDASMANMILFCGNTFLGLSGIALLLILDIISESEATDNARWVLHKIFLISPQFALGDGLLEIAKNTIQAQVLGRFGMETYRDPFNSDLIALHCVAMAVVGTFLFVLNLAVEYDYFERILARFRKESIPASSGEMEEIEVSCERRRVQDAVSRASAPVRLHTIGNINAGFVDTEDGTKKGSIKRIVSADADVAACVGLGKVYPALGKPKVAVRALTLGFPVGQCTALLGQNGAGKSTTFAMLTGQVRPSVGQIFLNERAVTARQLCEGHISYCPQSDAIDSLMTVRETLVMYCRLRGITEQDTVIRRTLDAFSLGRYAHARCGALSGGNRRKLCAAVALMGRARLVLLDEPTSGMDPVSRSCVWRGVSRACGARRGVLLSTHALGDARRLAARVALLRNGDLAVVADLETCLDRFGGGYIVQCVCRGSPRALWKRVAAAAPQASLRVLHQATVHFLIPNHVTVGSKEITTKLSDIFRLMSQLQSTCDVEDYTVNQSSLDQMFLSFTDKADMDLDTVEVEPLPSPPQLLRKNDEDDNFTSL